MKGLNEMKKVKHWLHLLLVLFTGGLWLPLYVIVIATTEMYNRGYRVGKAAGRVEKSNEYEAERLQPKVLWQAAPDAHMNCRCVVKPIFAPVTPFERFKELGDRKLSGYPLDSYEEAEYQQLRKVVIG